MYRVTHVRFKFAVFTVRYFTPRDLWTLVHRYITLLVPFTRLTVGSAATRPCMHSSPSRSADRSLGAIDGATEGFFLRSCAMLRVQTQPAAPPPSEVYPLAVWLTEEVVECSLLVVWCTFVWYQIHHRRLDYSTDPSMCGLTSSRVHVAVGVVVGSLTPSTYVLAEATVGWTLLALGWALFVSYTVRNLKHRAKLRAGFEAAQKPPPSTWYSSMTRQQMQLHVGIGIGRACAVIGCLASGDVQPFPPLLWPLRVLCFFSLAIGGVQLSMPPLPEDARSTFAEWVGDVELT